MARFDGFVLLAEMRTGSNYLEETLNLLPGLTCHGEVFNPGFVGQHDRTELFGMNRAVRDAEPLKVMRRIFERTEGLGGFRLFHDHNPLVMEAVLRDRRIAKIHLTRNPLDSYVSGKIASATGQWRLTDVKHRKSARVRFDPAEYETYLSEQLLHRTALRRMLQETGQVAFPITFEETADVDVINGLASFVGLTARLGAVSGRLKRQNPAPLSEKVENFDEMQETLARLDLRSFSEASEEETRHSAAVPTFVAAARAPLLFLPIKGGPSARVEAWLSALDGGAAPLQRGFTRKTLRQWKNRNKGARSFVVVSHPVTRAYAVFERFILDCGPGSFAAIRRHLCSEMDLPIPAGAVDETYPDRDRREAFLGFLDFVKNNLAGRTPLRTDPAFSSQTSLLQSLSEVIAPDMVIRAGQEAMALVQLGEQVQLTDLPQFPAPDPGEHALLSRIYDDEVEAAVRSAYNRDFMAFGFRRWNA